MTWQTWIILWLAFQPLGIVLGKAIKKHQSEFDASPHPLCVERAGMADATPASCRAGATHSVRA